jgi:hypothetical protein
MRSGFEKEFWSLGTVNAIVEITTAGILRLSNPRGATSIVRNPGRPNLLANQRSEHAFHEIICSQRQIARIN